MEKTVFIVHFKEHIENDLSRGFLEEHGHEVVGECAAVDALERIKFASPDVVILDPDAFEDGIAAIKQIRWENAKTAIITRSEIKTVEEVPALLLAGAHHCTTVPLLLDILCAAVDAADVNKTYDTGFLAAIAEKSAGVSLRLRQNNIDDLIAAASGGSDNADEFFKRWVDSIVNTKAKIEASQNARADFLKITWKKHIQPNITMELGRTVVSGVDVTAIVGEAFSQDDSMMMVSRMLETAVETDDAFNLSVKLLADGKVIAKGIPESFDEKENVRLKITEIIDAGYDGIAKGNIIKLESVIERGKSRFYPMYQIKPPIYTLSCDIVKDGKIIAWGAFYCDIDIYKGNEIPAEEIPKNEIPVMTTIEETVKLRELREAMLAME